MAIKKIFNSNKETLFISLAKELSNFISTLEAPFLPVALPGGRSVVGLLTPFLKELEALPRPTREKLRFFMLDERCVPIDSDDSNFKLLSEGVFNQAIQQALLTPSQLYPFDISQGEPAKQAELYKQELDKFGGKFAVAVLGVGEDAHVGALFPDHHSVSNPAPGFILMDDSPKPPPKRMSIARSLLEKSDLGIALFIGEAKREALEKFEAGVAIEHCPVSILKMLGQGIVATDLVA